MKGTKNILYLGILVAIEVILTRFFAIQTPIIRIGFGFLPIALAGIMFGPLAAGTAGVLADTIGMALFPKGAYFPGFTLSAFATGALYGLLLHSRQKSMLRIAGAVIAVTLAVDLGMNTVWISMITGKAVIVLMHVRLIKAIIMMPIKIFMIQTAWKYLRGFIGKPLIYKNQNA